MTTDQRRREAGVRRGPLLQCVSPQNIPEGHPKAWGQRQDLRGVLRTWLTPATVCGKHQERGRVGAGGQVRRLRTRGWDEMDLGWGAPWLHAPLWAEPYPRQTQVLES